jgi:hypothetical protein
LRLSSISFLDLFKMRRSERRIYAFSGKTSIHFNFVKAHALKQRGYGGALIVTSIGNDPAQRRFLSPSTLCSARAMKLTSSLDN